MSVCAILCAGVNIAPMGQAFKKFIFSAAENCVPNKERIFSLTIESQKIIKPTKKRKKKERILVERFCDSRALIYRTKLKVFGCLGCWKIVNSIIIIIIIIFFFLMLAPLRGAS